MKLVKTTNVSPLIERQLPCYKALTSSKKLPIKVHFDYLNILVESLNSELEALGLERIYKIKSSIYDRAYRVRLQGIEFTLFEGPRFFTEFNFAIALNPRDFMSFAEYVKFISMVIGAPILKNPHRITRIDLAFTVPSEYLSPASIYYSTHTKWKRRASKFLTGKVDLENGQITGVRSNSRSMDFSAYERSLAKHQKSTPLIRFELQSKGCSLDSLRLRCLNQLAEISSVDIFRRLEFYDPTLTTASKKTELQRFMLFQQDVLALGFQHARIKHNRQRHFQRDIGRFLVPLKVNNGKARLSYVLRKRFDKWLKNWFRKE